MPEFYTEQFGKPLTWKEMPRWMRKVWHKENDDRAMRGLRKLSRL
jgi:hypothetical protein